MAKYNTETYKSKIIEKYRDKFNLSKVNYINSYHKVIMICKEHNEEFLVDPISLIRTSSKGDFCPKCLKNKKLTHEEYMNKINKYKDMYDLSEVKFINTRSNIKLICPNHGVFYREARHLSTKGISVQCPKCNNKTREHPSNYISEQEDAVFYKIMVEHKETKLKWLKIGITSYTTKHRYRKYKNFNIEVIEEIFGTGVEVIKLEKEYKEKNKKKRFYIPHYINFNGRTESYIIDDEVQLKNNQVKFIRDALLEKQNGICPICKNEVKMPTLDHFHSKRHNGDGLVRGVLCNNCNRMVGVIENKTMMNGISFTDLPNWLRNLADYLDKENYPYIHPSEIKKEPKISKRNYNKCKKLYDNEAFIPKRKNQKKKVFPGFPKSSKLTKDLSQLFERFEISPYN